MKYKQLLTLVLPLVIFIAVAFFLWVGLHHNPRQIPSPLIGKPMPAFRASSLQDPRHFFTEQDFRGHITVLNVFATWCSACRVEHPVLMEGRRGLQQARLVGLSYKDERQKALNWLQQYGNPYDKVIFDPQGNLGINLGVYGTPETFIIDKQGIICYKFTGNITASEWQRTILPEVRKCELVYS